MIAGLSDISFSELTADLSFTAGCKSDVHNVVDTRAEEVHQSVVQY